MQEGEVVEEHQPAQLFKPAAKLGWLCRGHQQDGHERRRVLACRQQRCLHHGVVVVVVGGGGRAAL